MLPRYQLLSFLLSFLFVGFLFLSLPEKGFSGLAQPGPVCCQFAPDECFNLGGGGGDEPIPACLVDDAVPGFCNETTGLCEATRTTPIPTLGEWGMVAVILVLGAVGIVAYRRRRSPA